MTSPERTSSRRPGPRPRGRRPSAYAGLRREAAQCAPHVALAQPLERAIPQLAHALARHAEHRADLLERMLASTLEPEVEAQHLGITAGERAQRLLDLVGEEPVHGLIL